MTNAEDLSGKRPIALDYAPMNIDRVVDAALR